MKYLILAAAALGCMVANAQTGVDAMAKQRAKDVANENNHRNVETPPTAAATPTASAPAPAPVPLNAAQQAYARFQSSLYAVNSNSTAEAKQQFTSSLGGVAQGANKPSQATVSKLSDHLTTALAEAKLSPAKKTHVAQEVAVLMNSGNQTSERKQELIKDVQSTLEAGGSSSENAAAVAADLQSAADEIQKTAAK